MKDLLETIEDCYEEFFKGDYEAMKQKHDQVEGMAAICQKFYGDTAPQLEFAPGPRMPFKHKFFGEVQDKLVTVIAELEVLTLGASDWKKAEVKSEKSTMRQAAEKEEKLHKRAADHLGNASPKLHAIMSSQSAFSLMKQDVEDTMKRIFTTVIAVLEQDKEQAMTESNNQLLKDAFNQLTAMEGMLDLEAAPGFYKEVNRDMDGELKTIQPFQFASVVDDTQARLTVVVNSLKRATTALGEIGVLCLRENIY